MASSSSSSSSSSLLISLFILIQFLCGFSTTTPLSSSVSADKVKLGLYYETLCPYCSSFMVNHLSKIFENGLIDIIDLNLVPYGNARLGADNTITCQHGPNECLLNTAEACAINVWPDLNKHWAFIDCVEYLVMNGRYQEWQNCFGQTGLDPKPINDCMGGPLGKELELRYANETNNLNPPHKYVPWVVVAEVPIMDDYEQFATYVCRAYKGTPPKACVGLPLEVVPKAKSNEMLQVSYAAEEATPEPKLRLPAPLWRRHNKF